MQKTERELVKPGFIFKIASKMEIGRQGSQGMCIVGNVIPVGCAFQVDR